MTTPLPALIDFPRFPKLPDVLPGWRKPRPKNEITEPDLLNPDGMRIELPGPGMVYQLADLTPKDEVLLPARIGDRNVQIRIPLADFPLPVRIGGDHGTVLNLMA